MNILQPGTKQYNICKLRMNTCLVENNDCVFFYQCFPVSGDQSSRVKTEKDSDPNIDI